MAHGHRLDLIVRDIDRGGCRRAWRRSSSSRVCTRSWASRLESGSSIRKTAGSRTIARPSATRCRWPPESCSGRRSRSGSSPSELAARCDALVRFPLRHTGHLQREGDVLEHGHVRIERVVLEDHRHVAVAGSDVIDQPAVDVDLAVADIFQPGDHLEQGALAAARRPEQHQEFMVLDGEVDRGDRLGLAVCLLTWMNST